jgi:hypothetical protein
VFEGEGKVLVDGDAAIAWQAPGRIGLIIKPSSGFSVRILETSVANPVRSIAIVPASKELTFATDVYQPGFLKLVNGEGRGA